MTNSWMRILDFFCYAIGAYVLFLICKRLYLHAIRVISSGPRIESPQRNRGSEPMACVNSATANSVSEIKMFSYSVFYYLASFLTYISFFDMQITHMT